MKTDVDTSLEVQIMHDMGQLRGGVVTWFLLACACCAAGAAAEERDTAAVMKRLDRLHAFLSGVAGAAAPATWKVTRAKDAAFEWTFLVNGTAKEVSRTKVQGVRLVRKLVRSSNVGDALAKGRSHHGVSNRELVENKHVVEAVAELYYMEYLRGLPGIPDLWGAWVDSRGLSYVVVDAGPAVYDDGARDRTRRLWDKYEDLAKYRPIAVARALLLCFLSFSEVGGYFSDDLNFGHLGCCVQSPCRASREFFERSRAGPTKGHRDRPCW